MRYALIRDNTVENVILWDGKAEYQPPEGAKAVKCPSHVSVGWTYSKGEWTKPEETE